MHNFFLGLTTLLTAQGITYILFGAVLGMIFGVIPGLGIAVVLSILLAFVQHMSVVGMLCLFLGAHAGSYFSASISSILLNTPAHPEAFPITLDGYPMARRGEPGRALGLSAASTCIGGIVGCGVLIAFLPVLNSLPSFLHPPEYVALVTLAMLLVGALGTDSVAKAVISMGIGLLFASVGESTISGRVRYDLLGGHQLVDGVSLVAMALGLFAVPQMMMVFGTGTRFANQDMTGREIEAVDVELTRDTRKQVTGGVLEAFRHWKLVISSALVSAVTGIVPGIGGFTGNYIAYAMARQFSRKSNQFGTGIPEGIVAPEAASLAKEAGQMIPIIGLAVPGGVGGALFVAALQLKDIRTGFGFTTTYPVLAYQIAWVIALTGIIGTTIGLVFAPQLAKVTKVPGPVLVPFVLVFSIVGTYLAEIDFFACKELLFFAVIGIVLRRLRYPVATAVLGLVLGQTFEGNIYLTHTIYPGWTFLEHRWLADVLFGMAVLVLVDKGLRNRRGRNRVTLIATDAGDETQPVDVVAPRIRSRLRRAPVKTNYPVLAALTTLALVAWAVAFGVIAYEQYDKVTRIMPLVGVGLILIPAALRLPFEIIDVIAYVRHSRANPRTEEGMAHVSGFRMRGLPRNLGVVGHIRKRSDGYPKVVEYAWGIHGQYTREVWAFLWLAAALTLAWLIGFGPGAAIFMALYGVACTGRVFSTMWARVVFAVLTAALMWFISDTLFRVAHVAFHPKWHFSDVGYGVVLALIAVAPFVWSLRPGAPRRPELKSE